MDVEICLAIVTILPICFVGVTKSRKAASVGWVYERLISYATRPSWHENCTKPAEGLVSENGDQVHTSELRGRNKTYS